MLPAIIPTPTVPFCWMVPVGAANCKDKEKDKGTCLLRCRDVFEQGLTARFMAKCGMHRVGLSVFTRTWIYPKSTLN